MDITMFRVKSFHHWMGGRIKWTLEQLMSDGNWTVVHADSDDEKLIHQLMGLTRADRFVTRLGIENYQDQEHGHATRTYWASGVVRAS